MTPSSTNPANSPAFSHTLSFTMEKKRPAGTAPDAQPPAKQLRANDSTASSSHPENDLDSLVTLQRAQLAAKIAAQNREISWLRDKVDELKKLVAVLDAAPRAALYHMGAVREDLTLTVARMGLAHTVDVSHSPVAAVMLNAEEITNQSLMEMPIAIKKLTAQIAATFESQNKPPATTETLQKANDDLHLRVRQVSDQLERYAEREKESLVSSTTAKDEYDDLKQESSLQRRRIVSLEQQLLEKQRIIDAQKMSVDGRDDDSAQVSKAENGKRPKESTAHSSTHTDEAYAALKNLSERRLEELQQAHEEHKKLATEAETLRTELAKRDATVVPLTSILSSALYQTMEANLQQLYVKENSWKQEQERLTLELEEQRKDSQEQLESANTALEKVTEDFKKQLDELRRVADVAKTEKDKVDMKSDARHTEHATAASVIEAANKRAEVSNTMRGKLSNENEQLNKEVKTLREQLSDIETQLKDKGTVSYLPLSFLRCCTFHDIRIDSRSTRERRWVCLPSMP